MTHLYTYMCVFQRKYLSLRYIYCLGEATTASNSSFSSSSSEVHSTAECMEKALTKVGSSWIAKKAKEEIKNINGDLSLFSNAVEEKAKWIFNKLKGQPQRTLPDLLRLYNLPPGLFPRNIKCYEFDESKGKLIVHLDSPCEVSFKDSSVVRYSVRVKAKLSRGKLEAIEGMKTKVVALFIKVTCVAVEGYKSDKVWFTAGLKSSRPKDAYEMPRTAIDVKEF